MELPPGTPNPDEVVRIKSNVVAFELVTVEDRNIRRVVHTLDAQPAIEARRTGEPVKLWLGLDVEE